jgi:hypothetical protein
MFVSGLHSRHKNVSLPAITSSASGGSATLLAVIKFVTAVAKRSDHSKTGPVVGS